jgi:hypothetical protein
MGLPFRAIRSPRASAANRTRATCSRGNHSRPSIKGTAEKEGGPGARPPQSRTPVSQKPSISGPHAYRALTATAALLLTHSPRRLAGTPAHTCPTTGQSPYQRGGVAGVPSNGGRPGVPKKKDAALKRCWRRGCVHVAHGRRRRAACALHLQRRGRLPGIWPRSRRGLATSYDCMRVGTCAPPAATRHSCDT